MNDERVDGATKICLICNELTESRQTGYWICDKCLVRAGRRQPVAGVGFWTVVLGAILSVGILIVVARLWTTVGAGS